MSLLRRTRITVISLALVAATTAFAWAAAILPAVDAAADGQASTLAGDAGWVVPLGPPGAPAPVIRGFDPPQHRWLPGHRGVDLAAPAGAPVRAAADGVVVHAGIVAGVGVVSISHGQIRSTYQPIDATVSAGDHVSRGQIIGALVAPGSHCATDDGTPDPCLHWGARRGPEYLDPLSLVSAPSIRLLPLEDRAISEDPPPPGTEALRWPVAQPYVTSPFGMRVHPVTGVHKLHDGTDFRAPCGTPIRAAAPGTVTVAGDRGAYGIQVGIDHGSVGGHRIVTSSSHLTRALVSPGARIQVGQIIGLSGTTGLSTGCHLHFMVYRGGQLVDPMTQLPGSARRDVSPARSVRDVRREPQLSTHPPTVVRQRLHRLTRVRHVDAPADRPV